MIQTTLHTLSRWNHLGTRRLENRTVLIGHVPFVAPEAWLHALYAPLNDEEIGALERRVERALPAALAALYRACNGLRVFSGSLNIYGLRANLARRGDSVWQPFDIGVPNARERPLNTPESWVFFGGYESDGSKVCITGESGEVLLCAPRSARSLRTWPDLDTFLADEIARIAALYDVDGRLAGR